LLAGFISAVLTAASAEAATIHVTNLNDSGAGSLRQVIQDANANDTIQINLVGTITLTSGGLTIDKSLSISGGPGGRFTAITRGSGAPNFRIFTITSGTVSISSLAISNGLCGSNEFGGGAISVSSPASLSLNFCTISGNDANGNNGGGIINNGGKVDLFSCTISGNQASVGGGIENNGGGGSNTMSITNCTVVGNGASNTSTIGGGGGGIDSSDASLVILNSTVAANSATTNASSGGGGGIRNVSSGPGTSALVVGNTIVAANSSNQLGRDVLGAFISQGYNLIRVSGDSTGFGSTGDQLGTAASPRDADLGPLRDNGGPVDTRAPNITSPAIDQGTAMGSTSDGRGRTRPYDNPAISNASGGDGSDIGAVELQPPIVVTNNNDSGTGSLRQMILDAQTGDTITFAPNVTGTINLTSGELYSQLSITIDGPGETVLTVARSAAAGTAAFRVFEVLRPTTVTISGLTISNGNPPGPYGGGGISNSGTLTVRDCTIQDNNSSVGGGGIENSGTLTVTRCSFARDNSTGSGAGGLENTSSLATATVTGSTFHDNVGASGGGIANEGTLSLTNCTISGNTGDPSGGGVYNATGTLTLLNCTVANNSVNTSDTNGGGGGIFNSGTAHLGNTIVAANSHNQGGRDVFGAFVSDGYNLIRVKESSTGFTDGVNHDLVGTVASPRNAFLGSLQDNGGTTLTLSLGSSSPAIDAGNNPTAPARDQRGFLRAGRSDIGAFEFNGTLPVTLANISTRAFVQTGDNVLIGGFIVTGNVPKKVMLRGIGPSLNIAGKLDDPILELHDGTGLLVIANDNWKDAPNKQAIIDSTIAPTNDAESAILMNLNPGAYTAILKGAANNGTGVGVVEAYDLDLTANAKLANISTRCFVQGGDNVMIGGFIVLGVDPQNVVVEALGPSLPVPGNLADPTLELRDGNGTLLDANDNWGDSPNKQAIIDSTIPPTNDLESAIVATLPANGAQYTAIVRGAGGTTGVAVVEVFALN
jgi:hypothetical protein